MSIENLDKKAFLENFLSYVDLIADKKSQKKAWILGAGPIYCDFGETINRFYDHEEIILKYYTAFEITDQQLALLKAFSTEFRAFSDEHDWPAEFIDTPEWTKITEMAKEVLKAFHWKTPDQD
jgi:hypothetical protein